MTEKNWYGDAADNVLSELQTDSTIDGIGFLATYFQQEAESEGAPYEAGSEYDVEEAEAAARKEIDDFESWLEDKFSDQIVVHDGHNWQSQSTVKSLSPEDKQARKMEVGRALSLAAPPKRSIRTFEITEDDLSSLVQDGKAERFWQWVCSLGASSIASSVITIVSLTESNPPAGLKYVLIVAICATAFGSIGWWNAHRRISEIEKKIRADF